jgi:hypothetical protein
MNARRLGLVSVVFVASMSFLLAPTSVSAATGTSSLTIRSSYCRDGVPVKGVVLDCDPQQSITYWTDQTGGKTIGAEGSVTFTGLVAQVTVYQAGGPSLDRVSCGLSGADESAQVVAADAQFQVRLEAGRRTVCRVFSGERATDDPRSATLTIHARACPHGVPTTDLFAACHGHPLTSATTFGVDARRPRSLDGSGNVSFHELAGGDHVLRASGVVGNHTAVRLFCTGVGEVADAVIHLEPGAHVTCDYYVIHP